MARIRRNIRRSRLRRNIDAGRRGVRGLELVSLAGIPFSLSSIDLAEYSSQQFQTPAVIPITGDRTDGTTVSVTFTTDGVIDGLGPLVDFQRFALPPGFQNLVRVRILTYGFAIDNVIVATPEPRSVPLAAVLMLSLAAVRRRSGATPG
ncbi:MAG: hypothetical protein ACHQ6T_12310 [Myxococcota bacterium]